MLANGGIGFELASQLLSDPSKHVIVCSRSIEKGQKALEELRSMGKPGTMELLQLDVADEKSICNAAETIAERHGRYVRTNQRSFVEATLTHAGLMHLSIMLLWDG